MKYFIILLVAALSLLYGGENDEQAAAKRLVEKIKQERLEREAKKAKGDDKDFIAKKEALLAARKEYEAAKEKLEAVERDYKQLLYKKASTVYDEFMTIDFSAANMMDKLNEKEKRYFLSRNFEKQMAEWKRIGELKGATHDATKYKTLRQIYYGKLFVKRFIKFDYLFTVKL